MGIALGLIRLSYDDFCRLTPTEFDEVYRVYSEKEESDYNDAWGRMRLAATVLLQPHTKKKITPEKVIVFPWEKKTAYDGKPIPSKEQGKERFEKLIARLKKDQQ